MSKPSAFLQKLQQEQKRALYIHRLFTIQQSEDMMLIADLKKAGYNIMSRMASGKNKYGETVHYKEYWLEEK